MLDVINIKWIVVSFMFVANLNCTYTSGNIEVVSAGNFAAELYLETEELEAVALDCPERFVYANGFLITATNCNENLLHIIDLKTLTSQRVISKGKGPSEFLQLYFSGHNNKGALYYRNPPAKATWIHPEKLFTDSDYHPEIIDEPDFIKNAENVFQIDDVWVYSNLTGEALLTFTDADGTVKRRVEHFPPVSYSIQGESKGYLYYSATSYNASRGLFVTALRYFPYLIFTDTKGNVQQIVNTHSDYMEPIISSGHLMPDENSVYYYDQVLTSEEYVFALRMNATLKELGKFVSQPVLEVFNWKGNAIAQIYFDRFVGGIAIDFENSILYAGSLCFEKLVPVLVTSNLPLDTFY